MPSRNNQTASNNDFFSNLARFLQINKFKRDFGIDNADVVKGLFYLGFGK